MINAYIPTLRINRSNITPEVSYRVKIKGSDGKEYIGTLIPAEELAITIRMDNGELMRFENED